MALGIESYLGDYYKPHKTKIYKRYTRYTPTDLACHRGPRRTFDFGGAVINWVRLTVIGELWGDSGCGRRECGRRNGIALDRHGILSHLMDCDSTHKGSMVNNYQPRFSTEEQEFERFNWHSIDARSWTLVRDMEATRG